MPHQTSKRRRRLVPTRPAIISGLLSARIPLYFLFVCAVYWWMEAAPSRSIGHSSLFLTGPPITVHPKEFSYNLSTAEPTDLRNDSAGSGAGTRNSSDMTAIRNLTTPATNTSTINTPAPTTTASPSAVTPIIELCLSGEVFGLGARQRLTALPTVKRNLVDVNEAHHGRPVRVTVATWAPHNQTGRDRAAAFRAHITSVFGPTATIQFLDTEQLVVLKRQLRPCASTGSRRHREARFNGLAQWYLRYHGCHDVVKRSAAPYAAYIRVDIVMRSPVLIRDATTEETRGAKSERRRIADLMGPTDLQAADLQRVGTPYYYVSTGNASEVTLLHQGVTSNAAVYGAEELVVPHFYSSLRNPRQWRISDWGGMGRRDSVAHLLLAFKKFRRLHARTRLNMGYPLCNGRTSEVHLASHLSTSTLPRIRPLHLSLAGRCDIRPEIPVDPSLIARQGMDGRDPNVFTDSLTGYIFTPYRIRLIALGKEPFEFGNSSEADKLSPQSSRDSVHDELVQTIASVLSILPVRTNAPATLAPTSTPGHAGDVIERGALQLLYGDNSSTVDKASLLSPKLSLDVDREELQRIASTSPILPLRTNVPEAPSEPREIGFRARPRRKASSRFAARRMPTPGSAPRQAIRPSVSPSSPGVKFLSHVLSVNNKSQCEPRASVGLVIQHVVGLHPDAKPVFQRWLIAQNPLFWNATSNDHAALLQEALCQGLCTKWPRDDGL